MRPETPTLALFTVAGLMATAASAQVVRQEVPGIRNFAKVESTVACAGAITPAAIQEVKKMGYASIINLRLATEQGADIATVHDAGASAQKATPEVRTLSGEWTFSAEGYVMPLSLRQDGTRVTGTLEGFHGAFPLQGEFRKGLIHFAGSSDGGGIRHSDDSNDIDLFAIGTLQPDGSLQGTLVSTVGNLTWHAERKTVHPGGPSSKHLHH